MKFKEMYVCDIESVLSIYIEYYNNKENSCWTKETARKRIHQVVTTEDSYGLIMYDGEIVIGFVMGYFKQYDDIKSYVLEEILIATDYQNKGYGSSLLKELETRVMKKEASCIELQAVADDLHEHYYGKAGYRNAKNFVMKVKWFE